MSKFTEALEAYGVDLEDVKKRFVDDEEFYKDCLQMFLDDNTIDKLKESIDKNDLKEAFTSAHTLKGIVGNLGLTPLFCRISDLVEDLREGKLENAEKKYAVIQEEYYKAAKLIKN